MLIKARVLDITPPAPSQFTRFTVTDNTVSMEWSSSLSEDVAYYNVERSASGTQWRSIWQGAEARSFVDTLPGPGLFRYQVSVIDKAGNRSEPSTVRSTQLYGTPGQPQIVRAVEDTFAIKISWDETPLADGYRIVRIDPSTSERVECANVSSKDLQWFDRISERDRTWRYEVAARNKRWTFGEPATAEYTPSSR